MKENTLITLVITLTFLFVSCSDGKLQPKDYIRWVEAPEHGLRQTQTVDSIKFTIQYKPLLYEALKQSDCNRVTEDVLYERTLDLDGFHYFELRVRKSQLLFRNLCYPHNHLSSLTPGDYFELFLSEHILLKQMNDTVNCSMFHHESDGGLRPFYNMLIAFENVKDNDTTDLEFILNDNVMVSHPFSFIIHGRDLKNIPLIKF